MSFLSLSTASCRIVVPIYRKTLPVEESFSLEYSLERLPRRSVVFAAPESLDISFYIDTYPNSHVEKFTDSYFTSIQGYNKLLLSEHFYQRFAGSEFILVLQTDAIILSDQIDFWCQQPFDWIGAPWPNGQVLTIQTKPFSESAPKKVHTHVGNGGLSLRRIQPTIQLLAEFAETRDHFLLRNWNEDLFFSLLGTQSLFYKIPSERTAARFSLEAQPEQYARLNQGAPPMGGHAWYRYNLDFWLPLMEKPLPAPVASALSTPKKNLGFWRKLFGSGEQHS